MSFDAYSFMRELSPFIDSFGLISQAAPDRDGGDSCHRSNTVVTALASLGANKEASELYYDKLNGYEAAGGLYRRHSDPNKWYSNPNNFSADQTSMLLVAAATIGDKKTVKNIAWNLLKRGGFHQNTYPNYAMPGEDRYKAKVPDFLRPAEVAAIIRGTRSKLLYPVLAVIDGFFLLDVVLAAYDDHLSKKKGKRTDQWVMLASNLLLSNKVMDTPLAFLARKFMKMFDYSGSFDWLFGTVAFNDPPLHKILIPACKENL